MASAVDDDVRAPAGKLDRTIVEGSLGLAVWRLAWPTMVQNIIGGLQGIIDQAMVGLTASEQECADARVQ